MRKPSIKRLLKRLHRPGPRLRTSVPKRLAFPAASAARCCRSGAAVSAQRAHLVFGLIFSVALCWQLRLDLNLFCAAPIGLYGRILDLNLDSRLSLCYIAAVNKKKDAEDELRPDKLTRRSCSGRRRLVTPNEKEG
jgi:hypothetical protein